jgi:hypothetical protein
MDFERVLLDAHGARRLVAAEATLIDLAIGIVPTVKVFVNLSVAVRTESFGAINAHDI